MKRAAELTAERIADYIMQDIWTIPEDMRGALDTLMDKAQAAAEGSDDTLKRWIFNRLYDCAAEIGILEGARLAGLDTSKWTSNSILHDIHNMMDNSVPQLIAADGSDDVWTAIHDYTQSAIARGVCMGIRYAAELRKA